MKSLMSILIVLLLNSHSVLAEQARNVPLLAAACAACHGTNGHSVTELTPSLAGIDAQYIIDAFKVFRRGKSDATVMQHYAKGYTDEEIKLLAAFFESQK